MNHTDIIFAPVFLPLLGAAIAFCAKAFFRDRNARIVEYTGVFIGLGLPWIVLFYLLPFIQTGEIIQLIIGDWSGQVGITFRFDGLAWLVNLLGYSVASASWIYSLGAGPRGPGFSAMFLIQTSALAATSMTVDLFNLFVCLEVLGIASYVLVASSEKPGAFLASFSYMMVSATAMVFFLTGLFGLYRLTGALSYEGIAYALKSLPGSGGITAQVSLSLIVAAVAIRVAVMPLYGWLPDAHALAPHAISAVLSGVLIKTPLFALYRILRIMPGGTEAGRLMSYAGAFTALAAVIIALSQKDSKRLLAYHSISQIGYIVTAWGAAISAGLSTPSGLALMTAAFLHAFYHALFKGLLFLSVGTTTDMAGERDVYKLRGSTAILRRAGEKVPVTFLCYLTGALAIMAIPPFNGYASKAALSYALKGSCQGYLLYAAGIGTTASFIKLTRIYLPVKGTGTLSDSATPGAVIKRVPRSVQISQIFLASLCVAFGLSASGFSRFVMKLLNVGNLKIKPLPPELFSLYNLEKTAIITACGIFLFFIVSTKPGKKVLHLVQNRPRGFHGLFTALSLGTAVLAMWLMRYS
jgi:multicomponent Na+:H+ antiporter subunit D